MDNYIAVSHIGEGPLFELARGWAVAVTWQQSRRVIEDWAPGKPPAERKWEQDELAVNLEIMDRERALRERVIMAPQLPDAWPRFYGGIQNLLRQLEDEAPLWEYPTNWEELARQTLNQI